MGGYHAAPFRLSDCSQALESKFCKERQPSLQIRLQAVEAAGQLLNLEAGLTFVVVVLSPFDLSF